MSIDRVFFDVGGVLVDDEPAMLLIYRRLFERCRDAGCIEHHDEIFTLRENLISQGDGIHWHTAGKKFLGEDGWHKLYLELVEELRYRYTEVNIPFRGINDMLRRLVKEYKLGLAANQFTECRNILANEGWFDYFDVFGISEEVGYRKPDPEFFRWILREAKAKPGGCIMVGDRIDNDILPSKELGMGTIHFQMMPDYERLRYEDDFAKAYVASHKRAALKRVGAANDAEKPDYVAHSPEEVEEGIRLIVEAGG